MRGGYCDTTTSPEVERVIFRFQINGTSDPDVLLPGFQGVTDVTRAGSAGAFDVTFATKYPVMLGFLGTVLEGTPANDLIVKVSAVGYNSTTGVLRVTVVGADGTPIAEDPVNDDWVFCEVFFARRSGMHAAVAI